jgi:hypothetical protein
MSEIDGGEIQASFDVETIIPFKGEEHIVDVSLSQDAIVFAVVPYATGNLGLTLLEWPTRRLSCLVSTLTPVRAVDLAYMPPHTHVLASLRMYLIERRLMRH